MCRLLTAGNGRHILRFGLVIFLQFQSRCEMKRKVLTSIVLTAALVSISMPLLAHHGAAAYNMKQPVVLKNAVVTQYRWINPHPLIVVDYKDDKGNTQHWTTEMGSTPASELIGWSRTTLKVC